LFSQILGAKEKNKHETRLEQVVQLEVQCLTDWTKMPVIRKRQIKTVQSDRSELPEPKT